MQISKAQAIVTGGASGLGLATAKKIVAEGGQVTLLDINQEQGDAAANELGAAGAFIATDVSSEEAVNNAVTKAAETMGGVNMLVNCAGILGAGRVLGRDGPMPGDLFIKVIQVNLIGSFLMAKAVANLMQHNEPDEEGERGVIISTASVAAFEGQIGQAAYSASKAGVAGMALPIAREFSRIGVRVMTIAPGIFMTPMMEGMPEKVQESLAAQVPFPSRLGRPEEFADLVVCIYGNTMLNGETIRLDGAIRMQAK
ncbi:MAG: SDR family NAD(P)-dependent oxidoreductase [Gammaproteobacteria bacterium]|nr:SDR family NAD(P)-dependent oxidoreductase [Gammaproteobacteria bacterium]